MSITIFGALAAGTLSFLSPCVFPLVPGYLSFLGGSSTERGRVVRQSIAFTLGFALVFIAMGATATSLGRLLGEHKRWLEILGGAVILVFGLHLLGVFRISLLFREARFQRIASPKGFGGAMLVGMAFGFGWSPCIGPMLGGVLTLAASEDTLMKGVLLLSAYALGLAIPFILAALAWERFLAISQRIRPILPWIEKAGGALLAVFGLLLLWGKLGWVASLLPGLEALAL